MEHKALLYNTSLTNKTLLDFSKTYLLSLKHVMVTEKEHRK